jgi:hypothetical protein
MGLFGPSYDDVWSRGETTPGTLVGIRRFERSDDDSTFEIEEYAVELADGSLVGIRQPLSPRDEVRLGMPVEVARLRKDVVIRWGEPASGRWKTIGSPARGIVDEVAMKGIRGEWTPVELELSGFGARSGMLGLTSVPQAHVKVHADGLVAVGVIDKWEVPFYASHLGAVGSRMPGLRHPRDLGVVRVDWPAAVAAEPGIGVPPLDGGRGAGAGEAGISMMGAGVAAPSAGLPGLLEGFQQNITEKVMAAAGIEAPEGPAAGDPVPWATYLAVSVAIKNEPGTPPDEVAQRLGLGPGDWEAAHKRWLGRMMTDWRLGAEYGQAMS